MSYIKPFSYDDFLTYKIQEGDTPESVAEKLDIDLYALRSYHNRYCESVEDCIGPTFPRHLKFVIVKPPTVQLTDEEKEQQRKKVVFNDSSRKLSLDYSHGEKAYAVLYTIESGEEVHTIKQQIKISWRAKNAGYHFYYVSRDKAVYVNDTLTNTMAEDIAQKASQALYPLLIVVDENGKWVGINNYNQIVERWNETKRQIKEYYKGDQTKKYFKIYNKNLADQDTLFFSLQKDWFLNALFNEIHVQYPPTESIQRNIGFPYLAKSENIQYKVEQKIDDLLDVDSLIVIDIEGRLNDKRTRTDFENELNHSVKEYSEEKPAGNYKAKYYLNPNSYMPEAFILSASLELDTPQKYTVTATHLHTAKEMVIGSRESIFAGIIKPQKKDYFILYAILSILACILIFVFLVYFIQNDFEF
jgi:hypothetical protein